MTTLIFTIIFIILFLTISKTLTESQSILSKNPKLLAFCITALCLIGLNQPMEEPKEFNFLLLPYITLAICVLAAILIKLFFNFIQKDKTNTNDKQNDDDRMRR